MPARAHLMPPNNAAHLDAEPHSIKWTPRPNKPEVCCGKGRPAQDCELRRSIQGDCGKTEQLAWCAGEGRRGCVGHSSVHAVVVAKAGQGEGDRGESVQARCADHGGAGKAQGAGAALQGAQGGARAPKKKPSGLLRVESGDLRVHRSKPDATRRDDDVSGTYGSPRVHQVLRRSGHRVVRLMRRHGIKARVATIRYTNPSVQRFYGSISNQQLNVRLDLTCSPEIVRC